MFSYSTKHHPVLGCSNVNKTSIVTTNFVFLLEQAKENPLKTLLEIITNYFLEHRGTSKITGSSSTLSAPQSKSSTSHPPDFSDEDHAFGSASMPDESRTQTSRYSPDFSLPCLFNFNFFFF